jgi:hypothetical protein
MADFHEHRATALFYIIYVGIGMYFMLNLFLALVYRSFADLEKVRKSAKPLLSFCGFFLLNCNSL